MVGRFNVQHPALSACLLYACISGCSPYPYQEPVGTLSTQLGDIRSSYRDGQRALSAETDLHTKLDWIVRRPQLRAGPGCTVRSGTQPCTIVVANEATSPEGVIGKDAEGTSRQSTSEAGGKQEKIEDKQDACSITRAPEAVSSPSREELEVKAKQSSETIFRALDLYLQGLAALTKASDRADLDAAAGKVSAALGTFATTLGAATGGGAGAAAGKAVSTAADGILWLFGEALDAQRLATLRQATQAACRPIHTVAAALAAVLQVQRKNRIDQLAGIIRLRLRPLNAPSAHSLSVERYRALLDEAFAATDAFEALRETDPDAVSSALSESHDELVLAIYRNDGQFSSVLSALEKLSEKVDAFVQARRDL